MSLGAPVLIIDDDPTMVEAVQAILEAAGYSTAAATDGFHGLKLARETKPLVIVCDMVMPNMAGADVFRTLSCDPATAKISRVMISGHADADRSCANAFLLKPFQADEMLRIVGEMTKRASLPKPHAPFPEPRWHG